LEGVRNLGLNYSGWWWETKIMELSNKNNKGMGTGTGGKLPEGINAGKEKAWKILR
jgi:hypothetical protein